MWGRLSRSWEFAKTSYWILWDNKSLIIFPLLAGVAALVVMASFLIPLWTGGTIEAWMEVEEGASNAGMSSQRASWVSALPVRSRALMTMFRNACLMRLRSR